MQLLLDNSYEFEKCDGLGLINGENIKLKNKGYVMKNSTSLI